MPNTNPLASLVQSTERDALRKQGQAIRDLRALIADAQDALDAVSAGNLPPTMSSGPLLVSSTKAEAALVSYITLREHLDALWFTANGSGS